MVEESFEIWWWWNTPKWLLHAPWKYDIKMNTSCYFGCIWLKISHWNNINQKTKKGRLFAEKETKRRPILGKGLLWRLKSPKGDLFGNAAIAKNFFLPILPENCSRKKSKLKKSLKTYFSELNEFKSKKDFPIFLSEIIQ